MIGFSADLVPFFFAFFLLAVFELSPTAKPFRLYQSMIWAVWKPRKGHAEEIWQGEGFCRKIQAVVMTKEAG
ncbi:hypothetical protein BRUCa_0327 [Brucella melitensis]